MYVIKRKNVLRKSLGINFSVLLDIFFVMRKNDKYLTLTRIQLNSVLYKNNIGVII